jgi:hypothetical protein
VCHQGLILHCDIPQFLKLYNHAINYLAMRYTTIFKTLQCKYRCRIFFNTQVARKETSMECAQMRSFMRCHMSQLKHGRKQNIRCHDPRSHNLEEKTFSHSKLPQIQPCLHQLFKTLSMKAIHHVSKIHTLDLLLHIKPLFTLP